MMLNVTCTHCKRIHTTTEWAEDLPIRTVMETMLVEGVLGEALATLQIT